MGPILFILYIADLIDLVGKSGLYPHLYADDTQICGFCSPDDTQALQNRVTVCISDVDRWMASNRLQLNAAKTEVLWCASNRQQHLVPSDLLSLCGDTVNPAKSARDLGTFLDSDMSMKIHVSRTVSSCFAALQQISSIRRSISQSASFTLSRYLVDAVALRS